jgi:hypothetical protein
LLLEVYESICVSVTSKNLFVTDLDQTFQSFGCGSDLQKVADSVEKPTLNTPGPLTNDINSLVMAFLIRYISLKKLTFTFT